MVPELLGALLLVPLAGEPEAPWLLVAGVVPVSADSLVAFSAFSALSALFFSFFSVVFFLAFFGAAVFGSATSSLVVLGDTPCSQNQGKDSQGPD